MDGHQNRPTRKSELSCRKILMGSTTLVAASAFAATAPIHTARAQQQPASGRKPEHPVYHGRRHATKKRRASSSSPLRTKGSASLNTSWVYSNYRETRRAPKRRASGDSPSHQSFVASTVMEKETRHQKARGRCVDMRPCEIRRTGRSGR
jgi:hypothetical protein